VPILLGGSKELEKIFAVVRDKRLNGWGASWSELEAWSLAQSRWKSSLMKLMAPTLPVWLDTIINILRLVPTQDQQGCVVSYFKSRSLTWWHRDNEKGVENYMKEP
jgi:hypothetical protein